MPGEGPRPALRHRRGPGRRPAAVPEWRAHPGASHASAPRAAQWARREPLAAGLLGLSLLLLLTLFAVAGGYLAMISRVNSQLKHQLDERERLSGLRDIGKEIETAVKNSEVRAALRQRTEPGQAVRRGRPA